MAYARYGRQCDWYIFWSSGVSAGEAASRAAQSLAVWHKDHRSQQPHFTYAQICDMLKSSDLSAIPGYSTADQQLLTECLSAFVTDVDAEFREAD